MGLPTALSYLACGMLPLLWLPTLPSGRASALLLGVALLCLLRRGGVSLRIGLLCLDCCGAVNGAIRRCGRSPTPIAR
ncbi:hypothetical protein O0544_16245 [Edwardsiella anguillarum]|nr:hypothetical protein [Edwardsiella anguillarum]